MTPFQSLSSFPGEGFQNLQDPWAFKDSKNQEKPVKFFDLKVYLLGIYPCNSKIPPNVTLRIGSIDVLVSHFLSIFRSTENDMVSSPCYCLYQHLPLGGSGWSIRHIARYKLISLITVVCINRKEFSEEAEMQV